MALVWTGERTASGGKVYRVESSSNASNSKPSFDPNKVTGAEIKLSGSTNLTEYTQKVKSGEIVPGEYEKTGELSTGGGIYTSKLTGEQKIIQSTPEGSAIYSRTTGQYQSPLVSTPIKVTEDVALKNIGFEVTSPTQRGGVVKVAEPKTQEVSTPSGMDVVQSSVYGGLGAIVGVAPTSLRFTSEGKTVIDPFKQIVSTVPGVGALYAFESAAGAVKIGERSTPEVRETVTALGILGGSAVSAGLATPASLPYLGSLAVGAVQLPTVGKEVFRVASEPFTPKVTYAEQKGAGVKAFTSMEEEASKQGFPLPFVGSTGALAYSFTPAYAAVAPVIGNIPIAGQMYEFLAGDTEKIVSAGTKSGEDYFRGLGYSAEEASSKMSRVGLIEYAGGGLGEVAGLFPAGAIGEVGVRSGVLAAIEKNAPFINKEVAKDVIGLAAFKSALLPAAIEGVSLYSSQQVARRQEIKPEEALFVGGISAITGGIGARFIARTSIDNPKLAEILYKSMWTFQIDEPAGDVTADILYGGSKTIVPIISGKATPIKLITPTMTVTPSLGTPTPSDVPSITESLSLSNTQTSNIVPSITETFTQTPSQSVTNTVTNIFNQTNIQTETYTNTLTNTVTMTETLTPSVNAPFLPFMGTGGTGMSPIEAKAAAKQQVKYYDEVAAAFSSGFKDTFKPKTVKVKPLKVVKGKKGKWSGVMFG